MAKSLPLFPFPDTKRCGVCATGMRPWKNGPQTASHGWAMRSGALASRPLNDGYVWIFKRAHEKIMFFGGVGKTWGVLQSYVQITVDGCFDLGNYMK